GVGTRPWRARETERLLLGRQPTEETLREAARAEFASARPLPQNAFKIDLAVDVITSAVRDLVGGQRR
ncbi:xanthine dehydrogenase family protein subunit M, partial [Streptomyces sp. NPDC020125]